MLPTFQQWRTERRWPEILRAPELTLLCRAPQHERSRRELWIFFYHRLPAKPAICSSVKTHRIYCDSRRSGVAASTMIKRRSASWALPDHLAREMTPLDHSLRQAGDRRLSISTKRPVWTAAGHQVSVLCTTSTIAKNNRAMWVTSVAQAKYWDQASLTSFGTGYELWRPCRRQMLS